MANRGRGYSLTERKSDNKHENNKLSTAASNSGNGYTNNNGSHSLAVSMEKRIV